MASSHVQIVGNLVRDPELKQVGERNVANMTVAVNRSWVDSNGRRQEGETSFVDVVAWNSTGVNTAFFCKQGDRVMVSGVLSQRSWEAEDGSKRSKLEIVADEIGLALRWAQVTGKLRRTDNNGVPVVGDRATD